MPRCLFFGKRKTAETTRSSGSVAVSRGRRLMGLRALFRRAVARPVISAPLPVPSAEICGQRVSGRGGRRTSSEDGPEAGANALVAVDGTTAVARDQEQLRLTQLDRSKLGALAEALHSSPYLVATPEAEKRQRRPGTSGVSISDSRRWGADL